MFSYASMLRATALVITFALVASSVRADEIEERLRKLEEEVASLKLENERLRRDLGLEVVARQADVKTSGSAENVQIGGLIQVQEDSGDRGDSRFSTSNSRFYLRRARLNMTGRFVDEFNFRAELELAGSLAESSGLRAQLTDAYLNWNRFDSANVRAGQFKTPFGFEQLYADPRLYTIERSLVNDRLTPGRQIGAQIEGEWLNERVSYAVGVFNGNGTNSNFNDNDRFLTAARFSVVPFSGRLFDNPSRWLIGVDGFQTHDSSLTVAPELGLKGNLFTGRRHAVGADTQFELGPLELWSEVIRETFDTALPTRRIRSNGGYGQASYYVIPDKLQFVGRYETFDPDEQVVFNSIRSSVFGVNYYFRQHDVKLQVDLMRGHVAGVSKEQNKIMARLQTAF